MAAAPKRIGRPSSYSDDIAAAICSRLAGGESLRTICETAGLPSAETVRRWLLTNEPFRAQYVRAREEQCDTLADEVLATARAATNENANAVRVQLDAIRWFAGKVHPKKYGDKIDVTTRKGVDEMSDDAIKDAIALLQSATPAPATESDVVH
jgi:hypothetical protein